VVFTPCQYRLTVWAEDRTYDGLFMTQRRTMARSICDTPHLGSTIVAGGHYKVPIGTERDGTN
jgi:hypothetical protein